MSQTNTLTGTDQADALDSASAGAGSGENADTTILVQAAAGPDNITLRDGHWAQGSSGDDTITGAGYGTFGVRFDDSPKPVLVRSDWDRVEDDGYGNRDILRGVNAFIGSAFADTIVGSRANDQFGSLEQLPAGGDSYVGGGGFDTVFYGAIASDFSVDLALGPGKVRLTHLPSGVTDTLEGMESIQFLDKSIQLDSKGNASYNIVLSASADRIDVNALPPSLQSRWGELRTGEGDDTISWRSGQIMPGSGDDTITFSGGRLDARANYGDNPGPVLIDLENAYAIDGWGDRDYFINVGAVSGSWGFGDSIIGSNSDDRFDFTDGGDTIDGRDGDDRLWVHIHQRDPKYITVSFDEQTGLYALRFETGRFVYFKNIETLEIGRNGQPNQYLKVSELSLTPEFSVDLRQSPAAGMRYQGSGANENITLPTGYWVEPGAGYDTITGIGSGKFGIRFDSSPKAVNIRADWDRILDDGYGFQDQLRGINAFVGSPYSDLIQGSWRDEFFGDSNAPPQGADTYIGYGGQDTVYYGANYADFSVSIDQNNDSAQVSYLKSGSTDTLTGIANLVFKDRTIELKKVNSSTPELYFSGQNESILESDLIQDNSLGRWRHIYAGGGDDRIVWSAGQLYGGEGRDTIEFSRGDLSARLNYGSDPGAVFVDLQNKYAIDGWGDRDTLVNVRAVRGSGYADTIIGSTGDDWFDDPWGGDTIDGATGKDNLWFWAHNKNYLVSFNAENNLYSFRWGSNSNEYFSFKNIEIVRIGRPGQNDQEINVSDLTLVSDLTFDLTKNPVAQTIINGGKGSDTFSLTTGTWVVAGPGYDQITGVGVGIFGVRFDSSPKGVTVRADWGRVDDDGFGFKDALFGINAYFGSPFSDYIRGSWWDEFFGSSTDASQGNDTYVGGGGFDTVLYPLNSTDYEISYDSIARMGQVKHLRTGVVDSIEQIAEIKFADQVLSLSSFGELPNRFWGTPQNDSVNKQTMLAADRWDYWVDYNGGDGNDSIAWRSGAVIGGRGEDTIEALGDGRSVWLSFDRGPRGAFVDLNASYAIDEWGYRDTIKNIYRIGGTNNRADTVIGSGADEEFSASGGGDFIDLGGGRDLYEWYAKPYSISISAAGDLILRDGPGPSGMSTLRNVETVRFRNESNREVAVSDLLSQALPESEIDLTKNPLPKSESLVRGTAQAETIILTPGTWAMASSGFDVIKAQGTGEFGIRFDESPAAVEVRIGWGPWASVQKDGYGFRDDLYGINAFFGSAFDDIFFGDWRDQLFGSKDAAPRGNDTYIGGGGFDTVRYFDARSSFKVEKISGGSGSDQKYSVEYLKTGAKDTLEGIASIEFADETLQIFSWGPGRKTAWGSSQNDVVSKSDFFSGDDYNRWQDFRGLDGDDRITWQNGDIFGGEGNDTIEVSGDNFTALTVQFGGREGGDYGVFVNLLEGFAIDEWGDRDTLINVRRVSLTGGADTVIGSKDDDYFWDSGGHDWIDGGVGSDTFSLWTENKGSYAIEISKDLSEVRLSWDGHKDLGSSGTVTLKNFELIRFDKDGSNDDYVKVSDLVNWQSQAPAALTAGDAIRWTEPGSVLGQPIEVTYSVMTAVPSYGNGGGGSGFVALSPAQKDIVRVALNAASEASGVSFREIADGDDAQIRIGANQQLNTKGYSFLPDPSMGQLAGDIWLDVETLQVMDQGKEGFWVLLHELGHALGLVHPSLAGEVFGEAVIDKAFDDTRYTVMSENFFSQNQYPVNFSMFDALALAYLYGPPLNQVSNDVYRIGSVRSKTIQTITDSGGWDLIDASLSTTGAYIDLRPGSLLSAGRDDQDYYALNNWAVGYATEIERVTGSDYDDIIIGTDRGEWFYAGDGNDQVDGGGGLDTLQLRSKKSDYNIYISDFSGRLIVSSADGESGADSINDIERLIFSDGGIAFDFDGSAGEAARLVYTMFGHQGLENAAMVGNALSAFDAGQSDYVVAESLLASAWFSSMWGTKTDASVLAMMFQNLFGRSPSQDEYAQFLPLFSYSTQGALVALVADLPFVDDLIAGGAYYSNGIGFTP